MRTFQGKKNRHGQWVIAGPHAELIYELMMEREVRVELPKRSHITRIARVGAAFPHGDEVWAYGYPATPIPIKTARPLVVRSRRAVKRSPVAAQPVATVTATERPSDQVHDRSVTAASGQVSGHVTEEAGLW